VVSLGAAHAQQPHAMTHGGGVMYHAPQWSPDGQWIVASTNRDGDTEVVLIRPDGSGLRQLTRNTVPDDMARWSRDGRRVLFQSDRSGSTAQYSMNPDGSDVRPEPLDSVSSRSPDGKTLLFEAVREGRGRLYLMTSARTNAREIATARHAEQGSFSPDGEWIVLEQRNAMHEDIARSEIVVARPDGSQPRVIATGTDPSWSPDGRLILFKTWDEPTNSLWISTVSPSGAGFRRLARGVHPNWSPDGARIAYMSDRDDGGADVWIMNRDGSAARCLTCGPPFR
jgi:Tol biopolymer transport system component